MLSEGEKDALFSKMLATISTDAPISYEVPEKNWELAAHTQDILSLCDELEFYSLKKRLGAKSKAESVEENDSKEEEKIDKTAFAETSIALWLLHSDRS